MSELFPAEQMSVDSPRLRWMKNHNLTTFDCLNGGECPETGTFKRWSCFVGGDIKKAFEDKTIGEGDTEDEAITNWAKAHGVLLWNEVGLKP